MALIARASITIADLNDPIQQGVAPSNPVAGMLWLDTSKSPPVLTRWSGSAWERVNEVEIGGVNLIDNSTTHTLVGDDTDTPWLAADALAPGGTYTFSVREIIKDEGSAAGVTWALINITDEITEETGTLGFTYGKQVRTFKVPAVGADWGFALYAGLKGATNGVTVTFSKAQLEEGEVATSWAPSPQDAYAQIDDVGNTIDRLDDDFNGRVQDIIDDLGLSDQFASADEFLALLDQVDVVRSDLSQQESNMTLTFSRLSAAETGITQIFSHFEFGDDGGTPYLDMGSSESSMKMRLTNTRLAFIQGSHEVAYFSDNKLYVTQLEVKERVSIGTSANGFLDIVTTPTGVGFKWRS